MRFLSILLFFAGVHTAVGQTFPDPLVTQDVEKQQQWVDSLYNTMDLEAKIGQLFMVMAFSEKGINHYKEIEENVLKQQIGGIIFSLGGPKEQLHWTNRLQAKAKTPLLIGMDAEWGVAMRLDSVVAFPWNMTLGAIQDHKLVEQIGYRIGAQAQRLGVHINFAPDVDINTNPNNPIIGNRSFGEDKMNVAQKGIAFIEGMHRAGVMSSAKHFPGHGDTAKDSHYDLPVINFDQERLLATEFYPFDRLVEKGVSSIMVGHLNIPALDEGVPASLSKKIIEEHIKSRYNYNGLIITDALNMGGAEEVSNLNSISVEAFLAGNDILLIPSDLEKAIKKMKRAFNRGKITEARLAHSVKKILKAKYKAGLSNFTPLLSERLQEDLNTPLDAYLVKKAMEEALTLVKKDSFSALLSKTHKTIHLALGDASSTSFKKHLANGNIPSIPLAGSIEENLANLSAYETVIVSFHRSNASPWKPSDFSKQEKNLLSALTANQRVVLVSFVKPYALSKLNNLNDFGVIIQAYQNNEEAHLAAAQLLTAKTNSPGKLPVSISEDFPVGTGINMLQSNRLEKASPFDVGMDEEKLSHLDTLAQVVLDSLMAPGFQVLAARKGKIIYHKAFGHHTFEKKRAVDLNDVYDLASMTKILTTLPLLMQAYESEKIRLSDQLGELSPLFKNTNKESLRLKEVLSHQSGIVPWVPFYKTTLKGKLQKLSRKYYRSKPSKRFSVPVASSLYGRNDLPEMQFQALLETKLLEKGLHYSDLPLLFAQKILEEKYNAPIDELVQKAVFEPLNLKYTTFRPLEVLSENTIVPSENDTYFRKRKLQGYVHDMAAALQGGVAGHAGLFSNAYEVATLMQMFLQKGSYNGSTFFSEDTFDVFNTCNYCSEGNRKGIVLDKPKQEGGGMAFYGISPESFGHSGFTGTYAWADPETEIVFVFLSNRTFPSMNNRLLIDHSIRPRMLKLVHDSILY